MKFKISKRLEVKSLASKLPDQPVEKKPKVYNVPPISIVPMPGADLSNLFSHLINEEGDSSPPRLFPYPGAPIQVDSTGKNLAGLFVVLPKNMDEKDPSERVGTIIKIEPSPAEAQEDKGSKNKRKLADAAAGSSTLISHALTEFPRYGSSSGNSQIPVGGIGSSEINSSEAKEEGFTEEVSEWDEPMARKLEPVLATSLTGVFQAAIKRVVQFGYSQEAAANAISGCAIYLGGDNMIEDVANDAVAYLKGGKDFGVGRGHMFDNMSKLVDYTMAEMVNVLRELRPRLNVAEALWLLIICDLSISEACQVEESTFNETRFKELSEGSSFVPPLKSETQISRTQTQSGPTLPTLKFGSFPNAPHEELAPMSDSVEKFVSGTGENMNAVSQTSASEEKKGSKKKGRGKREAVQARPKNLQLEKNKNPKGYGKGAFKPGGRYANIGGFVVEKRPDPSSELPPLPTKMGSSTSKTSTQSEAQFVDQKLDASSPAAVTGNAPAITPADSIVRALPAQNAKLGMPSSSGKKQPASKSEPATSEPPKTIDYYEGIPFDKEKEVYVPQDDKDEIILKLAPRVQELQKELDGWTDWANQKVMQAARKLGKDQAELKLLRQQKGEAEQLKREKQSVDENTLKRMAEMEAAVHNANNQVEKANSNARKLEADQILLKKQMDAAKLKAKEAAASVQEALEREKKAMKDSQELEGHKALLQEERDGLKQKTTQLEKQVGKAKILCNQSEARWKNERKETEKLLAQAAAIRKEREEMEAAAKAEEERMLANAEKQKKLYLVNIAEVERKLSELKMMTEARNAAILRRDYGIPPPGDEGGSSSSGTKKQPHFHDSFLLGTPDRECCMCLSAEKTVIMLPCAHQVLCKTCNEIHEKKGMKECPACRTPIQVRFQARFCMQKKREAK